MYIQENLTTTSREVPGISWELSTEMLAKYRKYKAFSKLVLNEDRTAIVDIVEDTERKAAHEAAMAAEQPTDAELLAEKTDQLRRKRATLLVAFDVYKANVDYGILSETEEERQAVLAWYQSLLDITEGVTMDETSPIWPETPQKIAYYLPQAPATRRRR